MTTMSEPENEQLETLIQAYMRAKWAGKPDSDAAEFLGARLDRDLRDRIDALGLDGARLLTVDSAAVLAELETVEREAALEDAGAMPAAARVRAQEVHDKSKAPWRGHRMRPPKHRQPARNGRRRPQR